MTSVTFEERIERIGSNIEKSLTVMSTLAVQNQELRTLVLALQDRVTKLEMFSAMHGQRLENVESRLPQDRGIGRRP